GCHLAGEVGEGAGHFAVGGGGRGGSAGVAAFADGDVDRDACQQGHLELAFDLGAAALAKDVVALGVAGGREPGHVLDHAEDRHVHGLEHADRLAHVEHGNVLRRGDDDSTHDV